MDWNLSPLAFDPLGCCSSCTIESKKLFFFSFLLFFVVLWSLKSVTFFILGCWIFTILFSFQSVLIRLVVTRCGDVVGGVGAECLQLTVTVSECWRWICFTLSSVLTDRLIPLLFIPLIGSASKFFSSCPTERRAPLALAPNDKRLAWPAHLWPLTRSETEGRQSLNGKHSPCRHRSFLDRFPTTLSWCWRP